MQNNLHSSDNCRIFAVSNKNNKYMVHINDDNKSFSIELISGSQSGDSYLFNITKTVWGTQTSMTSQTEMTRRLKCDDDGNVYCGRHSNKVWINWPTGKLVNSYNPK